MENEIPSKDYHSSETFSKWYVQYEENDIRGPFDTNVLRSLLDSSHICGYTNVWCDGMQSWKAISDCEELKQLLINKEEDSSDLSEIKCKDIVDLCPNEGVAGSEQPDCEESLDEMEEIRRRKREKKKKYLQRKKMKIESGQWIDSAKNFSVYVSGLPKDTTLEEVANVFRRAGVIKIDPLTTLPKIKLYTDENGELKSDAKITFVNKESVEFAIRYLDNYHFRGDYVIHVEEAKYDPQKYQSRNCVTLATAELRKRYLAAKYEQNRLQSWAEEMDDGTGRRIVICKPMFSLLEAELHEPDSDFYKELKEEIVNEVKKYVQVEKVTPIPRHPQGVVCIKFKNSADAEIFISKFKDRMFDGRKLDVYFFDGKTDLQAQTIPSRSKLVSPIERPEDDSSVDRSLECDWIDEQGSDEEFVIKTE